MPIAEIFSIMASSGTFSKTGSNTPVGILRGGLCGAGSTLEGVDSANAAARFGAATAAASTPVLALRKFRRLGELGEDRSSMKCSQTLNHGANSAGLPVARENY